MSVVAGPERCDAARSEHSLLSNSVLMFATTLLMAGGGAVFWVLAARLQTPGERRARRVAGRHRRLDRAVRPAGAQHRARAHHADQHPQGRRRRCTRPRRRASSPAPASRSSTACCCRSTSPSLAAVLGSPLAIALYCVLVAGTALNVLTDSVFLAIEPAVGLPAAQRHPDGRSASASCRSLFAGAGAMGLYGSFGGASCSARLASLWVIFRHLPGRRSLSPSRELLDSRRFAGAGYATYVLTVAAAAGLPAADHQRARLGGRGGLLHQLPARRPCSTR